MKTNTQSKDSIRTTPERGVRPSEILFENGDILLTEEEYFSPEIIRFLDHATWGTAETLFKHTNTAGRISDLLNPLFVVLRIKNKVAATVVMERRKLYHGALQTNSYFVRYYASKVSFRNRRIVGLYSHKYMDLLRAKDLEKSVYYASIEKRNHRSININNKMGYSTVAEIKTIGFSRFFPKKQDAVTKADESDLVFIKKCLEKKYRDHTLFHSSYIGHKQKYYVYKENGVVLLGIQIHHANWIMKNLPGRTGKILIKVSHYLPLIRRIFNPKNWHFLGVEGIYISEGHEDKFCQLVEGVLALEGAYTAMIWLDKKGPDYQLISNLPKLGLINQFTGDSEMIITTSHRNLSKEEERIVDQGPVYVSSFDFI